MRHLNPKPTFDPPTNPLMKSNLLRLAALCFAGSAVVLLASCETTGDPSSGGIFWSEKKAQDRLNERQDKLENTERKTESTQRKSAATQRQIDQLQ